MKGEKEFVCLLRIMVIGRFKLVRIITLSNLMRHCALIDNVCSIFYLESYGFRLDIPAGTAVRFEPGETRFANLTEIGGKKVISGGNGLASGKVDLSKIKKIMEKIIASGFQHLPQSTELAPKPPCSMTKSRYVAAYGPTLGDKVRLGDTNLFLEIEYDHTSYGDESVFGG